MNSCNSPWGQTAIERADAAQETNFLGGAATLFASKAAPSFRLSPATFCGSGAANPSLGAYIGPRPGRKTSRQEGQGRRARERPSALRSGAAKKPKKLTARERIDQQVAES
jgi:hypothetical protein